MKASILTIIGLCAVQPAAAADFSVTNVGFTAYAFSGAASGSNPTLTLTRGTTYTFAINAPGHPFWIKTVQGTGTQNAFPGVTGNGTAVGTISWSVPQSAPDTLSYNCQFHSAMTGTIHVTGSGATATPTPAMPTPTPTPAPKPCIGDCNGDGQVTVNELVKGVTISLGATPPSECPSFDSNDNGEVTVNELIQGVNAALNGCGG